MSQERVRILFVCMGNICRSPTAESVMRHLVEKHGLQDRILIDSAGTIGYHSGNPSDARTREAGERRGYVFEHRARQVTRSDFSEFDYIVAMDEENLEDLQRLAPRNSKSKVSLLLEHCTDAGCREVPDPYYGGPQDFENVLDLVEKGCEALLARVRKQHGQ